MSRLKLLLTTYSTAFVTSGGGESEMVQVAEMLDSSGIHCDIYGVGSRPLGFYDGVMHFSVHAEGYAMLKEAANRRKVIFLWPNVWWDQAPTQSEVDRIVAMAAMSRRLLFKSQAELSNFEQYIEIPEDKCSVIPIGISKKFLTPADRELLMTFSDVTDFALCLGLIEPVKNQLELIRALNGLKMNGLFVGGARDEDYYRQCHGEAHDGIRFLPFVQPCSALLRSIVAGCEIMVEPGNDPPGRSSLEGAIMKKPLVLIDGVWQREHFEDGVWYAPNGSAEQLGGAIEAALNDSDRQSRVDATYDRIFARHASPQASSKLVGLLAKESL
jgi:glycosyltransferase involved in cell wall biosynthesis